MAGAIHRQKSSADYTVACICPMDVELAPVEGMLDATHETLSTGRGHNAYTLGEIGGHNVVVAIMPEIGNNAAATVATQLLNDFPSVRFGLLVGIGGGVPGRADIRLGDVVISQPTDTFGGVIQYDMGKTVEGGRFQRTGFLNKPPTVLAASVQKLKAQHRRLGSSLSQHVSEMTRKYTAMQVDYSFPLAEEDQLFVSSYTHQPGPTCDNCDMKQTVSRSSRPNNEPEIHYGIIGSANRVVKDAALRDELQKDMDIMCVEMEAAGLMHDFPCLIIRGICDYADSHKNKKWQPYAAAVAAAYMRELLLLMPASQTSQKADAVGITSSPFRLGLHLGQAPIIEPGLFIGRLTELDAMAQILQPQDSSQQRRLVLGGLGGVGKTQLAIAYAMRYRDVYDSIFWLNAASEVALKQSLRIMGEQVLEVDTYLHLQGEQILLHVSRWLADVRNPRWLLIFDNYDEPESFDLLRYCPHGAHGSIIVTTRLLDQVAGQKLSVTPFENIVDGVRILESRSKRKNTSTDTHAYRLAKRIKGFPLSLATAGAYLYKSTWTFEQYLQEYEIRWNVNPRRPLQLSEYRDRTLYTTWDLSYQRLEGEDADAARLLKLLAYFDNQCIWFELLQAGAASYCPGWLSSLISDLTKLESMMRILVDCCFLEVQLTTQSYSMHSCVHDWTLASLNNDIDYSSYWYAFDCTAELLRDETWDHLGGIQYSRLAPHAVRLTHNSFNSVAERIPGHQLYRAEGISQLLHRQIKLESAEIMYNRTLASKGEILGPRDVSTLYTLNQMGLLYKDQGRQEKAEGAYMRALTGMENVLGPEDLLTLNMVHNLGDLYRAQNRLDEAESMYIRALAGKDKVLGSEDISTLTTVNSLGNLYRRRGKLDKAEEMYTKALAAGKKEASGMEDELTLYAVYNLGNLRCDRGRLDEAEALYVQALAGIEKLFGPEHTSTLNVVHNLGRLYYVQGKVDQAETMYTRALVGYEKALGPDHPTTLRPVSNLGDLYSDQGRQAEAETMYMRLLAWGEKNTLGPEHSSLATILQSVAILHHDHEKLAKAIEIFSRILGIHRGEDISTEGWNVIVHLAELLSQSIRTGSGSLANRRHRLGQLVRYVEKWREIKSTVRHLAKALISVNDDENAQIAHIQILKVNGTIPRDFDDVICDGCDFVITLASGRHICRRCADIDLCNKCMYVYSENTLTIPNCLDHRFFDAAEAVSVLVNEPEAPVCQMSVDGWFEKLKEEYPFILDK